MKDLVAGTVAVSADEAGRYTQFAMAMTGLALPPGTKTIWQIGNDIAGNRNRAVEQIEGDWLWFIDDDHAFAGSIVARLLEHSVDIVAPLVLRRQQPFAPVACVDDDFLDLSRCPQSGLLEVQHTGSAGMLIRREVFDAIEPPWFELGNGVSEDVTFCQKAREAGFDIYVDLSIPMGHITTCAVWPTWNADLGRWLTGYTLGDGFKLATEVCIDALAKGD